MDTTTTRRARAVLTKGILHLGEPLPVDLYGRDGQVRFRKGMVFHSEQSLNRLYEMGLSYEVCDLAAARRRDSTADTGLAGAPSGPTLGAREHPFRAISHQAAAVKAAFDAIEEGRHVGEPRLREIAAEIRRIHDRHEDAALAAVHRVYDRPYSSLQPVYSVILCEMAGRGLGLDESRREILALAALTANLGMYGYYDALVNQKGRLTAAQRQRLREHPQVSVERLQGQGVTDRLWLEIVRQHHERGDGSGYPRGLRRGRILRETAIVSVSDIYLAFIMPRAWRGVVRSHEALNKIYRMSAAEDEVIFAGFIKQIGVHPPGTLVRLASGEVAVVTRRNPENSHYPAVDAVLGADGRPLPEPVPRDTRVGDYRVVAAYEAAVPVEIDPVRHW